MRDTLKICAMAILAFALAALLSTSAVRADDDDGGSRKSVELTWMSIANWYFKVGSLNIIMDGYITRVPGNQFVPVGGDPFALTKGPWASNITDIMKVRYGLGLDRLDYVVAGHSHFDHTYDTAIWASLYGAPIIGGQSTCYQAQSQGVPASQCIAVSGSWVTGHGERLQLAPDVVVRVVRFNHSGNASNPLQHFARELAGPPTPDAAIGGFRAGVAEDYPNGGGGRAFLFTVGHGRNQVTFFVNNSASAFDLAGPIVVDGVNYGSPLENLAAAMRDAGITSVDAWIGTGGLAVAQLIVPVIHPKNYIPNHWDGLFNPFWPGMPFQFADANLSAYLNTNGIALLPQQQYFDGYRLSAGGVITRLVNHDIKQRLGFKDVQFPTTATSSTLRASALTASSASAPTEGDCDQ